MRLLVIGLLTALVASGGAADKVQPKFHRPAGVGYQFGGLLGKRLKANLENWELRAPESNPAMIQMFYDRDRKPDRKLLPWSGEFVGKYLGSSLLSYRILRDPRQKELIDRTVALLIASQGEDGYLGPFSRRERLTGNNWDIWGHYWVMRALLLYDEEFQSEPARRAAIRAADLLAAKFADNDFHFTNDGSAGQMNYSVIHAFAKLYRLTGNPGYLRMMNWIVKEWDLPGAGLYLRFAQNGKEMYEMPGNRWESLHGFQGMYESYLLTGDDRLGTTFRHLWNSILKGDRHNTGGFTSGERTTGNPYDQGAIETCCTVAWIDMSIDMLKLSGDSLVADELELSTFNGSIGGQHPSGRWWTYNTPMDGTKKASAHEINFQCRPGSPELNCCSVNAPRGMGLVTEWALLGSSNGLALNYYGPSVFTTATPGGQKLVIRENTSYPAEGTVRIGVEVAQAERFPLQLRIPAWSRETSLRVNGAEVAVTAGTYAVVNREWKTGDRVELKLDLTPHFWAGERELDARTSAYVGPVLLAFDPTFNAMDPDAIPEMDASRFHPVAVAAEARLQPWLLYAVKAANGTEVRLCDFASAGAFGNFYKSWLPIRNIRPQAFDRMSPVWANRP